MPSLRRGFSQALALLGAGLISFSAVRGAASPSGISAQERNWEATAGRALYARYAERGEIVTRQSPMYEVLLPVASAIASVAKRQYWASFHFILLNEPVPNAFSVPGGNVYVTTGMLSYLRNKDELAGVLCHEVNHDIHHDMYNVYRLTERGLQPYAYERAAEIAADRAGAYTCAKAGFNPWGMVWNMRLHRGMAQGPQIAATADHPSDDQRLAGLVALLTSNRATFGKFRDDAVASVPLRPGGFARSADDAVRPPQYPAPEYPQQSWPQPSPEMEPPPPPPV